MGQNTRLPLWPMRKPTLVSYLASGIHALLFLSMWVLYAVFSHPLMNGPSALPFVILFIADLPISIVAFGVMFTSGSVDIPDTVLISRVDKKRLTVFSDGAGGTMAEVGLLPFARVALEVATQVLPPYRTRFSKHQFTQPQLLAV